MSGVEAPASNVVGLLVSYQPDLAQLEVSLAAAAPQLARLVVVDNGSVAVDELGALVARYDGVLLPQGRNLGLATAQNIGIVWAREHAATHVLLLDQDSIVGPGMVAQLLAAYGRAVAKGERVAAVGPRFHDERDGDHCFTKVRFARVQKVWCDASDPDIDTDILIASGSLIPLAVLDDVGLMQDDLFIDMIDVEWCFRARSKGYALVGVCAASMAHSLGDSRLQLPAGRAAVIHSPTRLYYRTRNRVYLYRVRYAPRSWAFHDSFLVLAKLVVFALLVPPRLTNARAMLRGIRDGVRRRLGPIG